MSENVNTPGESWRTPRRDGGLGGAMVRMGLIAGGVIAVLALGAGGYALLGHRGHVVPVVEADSRPIRVRPDNPGGAMVAGAEEQIMGGNGHGQADAMAPPAEAPAPEALRAQIEAARPAPPAQPVSLTAPAPAAPATIVSDMPEVRPAAPVRPVPHPPAVPTGGTQVQLGALVSEEAAMTEWQRLSRRMPDLLGSRRPAVLRADRDGKTYWRLRTGGFSDLAAATAFCAQVRVNGGACAVASF